MRIMGLYADEALKRFLPTQYVNIYDAMSREFYCEGSMDALPVEVLEDPEEFFLEPTDEISRPIGLRAALKPN